MLLGCLVLVQTWLHGSLLSEDFAEEQEWMWCVECCGLLLSKGDGGNDQVLQQFGVSLQSISLNTKWVAYQGILLDPLPNAPAFSNPGRAAF